MSVSITTFLRNTLLVDAAGSAGSALLLLTASQPLSALLELPQPLMVWAGAILAVWTAVLLAIARRTDAPRLIVVDVIALNTLWVAASFGLLASGAVSPNLLGTAFVAVQALAVAGLTAIQAMALRSAQAVQA